MTPQFKFTAFHDTLAPTGVIVAQPVGWKDAKLILERHEKFNSLIEYFEGDFLWFGSAMSFFRQVEALDGPEAKLRLLVEIKYTLYGDFETVGDNLLDLSLLEAYAKGTKMYKIKIPTIREGFWAKFINHYSTSVDVLATKDIYGNDVDVLNKFTLPQPSQVIQSKYKKGVNYADGSAGDDSFVQSEELIRINDTTTGGVKTHYLVPNTLHTEIGEVKETFEYSPSLSEDLPTDNLLYFVKAKYDGDYDFDAVLRHQLEVSTIVHTGVAALPVDITWFYQVKRIGVLEDAVQIGDTQSLVLRSTSSIGDPIFIGRLFNDDGGVTLDVTVNLKAGDEFYLYAKVVTDAGARSSGHVETGFIMRTDYNSVAGPLFVPIYSSIEIISQTTFLTTTTDAILLPDVANNILNKIIGSSDTMVSPLFETDAKLYALLRGLHERGYSMADKPFFMSMEEWWEGASNIIPMGLDYLDGKIRIAGKSFYFNPEMSINIGKIANIVQKYKTEDFVKTVKIGYDDWSAESESGIDDPQTVREYRTKFATIGSDVEIMSKFFAASLGIEQTRRNRITEGKDWRLDEKIMIIAVKPDLDYGYTPELGSDFVLINNLLNYATRYNVRLFAARNFERFRPFLQGGLQINPTKFFFTKGEGNYDAYSEVGSSDIDYGANAGLSEKQDIDVTSNYHRTAKQYLFKSPLTWQQYKTIRDNREKAVGLSLTNESFTPHFINKLTYSLARGWAEWDVSLAVTPNEENGFRLLEDDSFRLLEDGTFLELD